MDYKEFYQQDITLRDYQLKAKEEIFSRWNIANNILYQMPTGTGKTRLFTSIIRDINVWGLRHNIFFRILIIAHRSELIEQCSNSLSKYRIDHGVLAGTMKEMRDPTKPIQVASIQTITHASNRSLINNLSFNFIIIDEAHHAIAHSYKKLWHFCPDAKKLGVTASPWRMNNCGFSSLFDAYIPSMPIKDFIKKGWLASYQYYSIPINSKVIESINTIREFDIDGDYVLSTGDFILQMSTLIAYDGIYNWDIAKLRKDRPSIDKYSKDFHYKFSPDDGCIIWCIPSAHCMGMVEVISGSVYLLGIDTGEPSYYKGYYGLNSLHTKYSMKIETARDYDKELYKVICEINDVKVGD